MVMVEYRIPPGDRADFVTRMRAAGKERMRNGATQWHVHQSVEDPGLWIETFHLRSWTEHLEQHERVSVSDMDLHHDLRRLHEGPKAPVVRHFIGPRR